MRRLIFKLLIFAAVVGIAYSINHYWLDAVIAAVAYELGSLVLLLYKIIRVEKYLQTLEQQSKENANDRDI